MLPGLLTRGVPARAHPSNEGANCLTSILQTLSGRAPGDPQFIAVDSGKKSGPEFLNVIDLESKNGKTFPVVLAPDGEIRTLSAKELKSARPSRESLLFWKGVHLDGETTLIEKHPSDRPQPIRTLVQEAKTRSANENIDLKNAKIVKVPNLEVLNSFKPTQEAFVIDEGMGQGKLQRLGSTLHKKAKTRLIWIPEGTGDYRGLYMGDETIVDEAGKLREGQKIISGSPAIGRGKISGTEIHEIGHMQTQRNLMSGKPDPFGIEYVAKPGKTLPTKGGLLPGADEDFYPEFSGADESRQFAYNLHRSLNQRPVSEVLEAFKREPEIPAHRVFGVTLENYHQSMDEAYDQLDALFILNHRHQSLAKQAKEILEKNFHSVTPKPSKFEIALQTDTDFGAIIVKTKGAEVHIPIVGKDYDQIIGPIVSGGKRNPGIDFTRNIQSLGALRNYATQMLETQITKLEKQSTALTRSEEILEHLRMNALEPLSEKDYLEYRGALLRVKTAVQFK
jgi:hypothetical protein